MSLSTPPTDRPIPTRRISFEDSLRDLPKHFAAGGDLMHSHVAACLSAVFPDGEEFFVRSVRHFRDDITDPDLKRDVAGFIGQEAVHGREHRMLNDRLDELGYPVKLHEGITRKFLALRERIAPPKSNLAATAAFEHFTATMAELLLDESGESRALLGDEHVRNLFMWHALEESEHKAVAFDLYQAVGGSERMRIWTMKGIRAVFVVGLGLMVTGSLLRDKETYKPGRLRASWKQFKKAPIVQRELWDTLREYDCKGFHPGDRDTTELVTTWRDQLFGDQGTLNDKLTNWSAA